MSIRVAADHNTQVNNGGSAFTGPVIVGLEDKESFESGDSKPAIFDDHSLAREQLVNIELEQRELEAERKKERQRVVTGMENEDLNALLRALEGVSLSPPPACGDAADENVRSKSTTHISALHLTILSFLPDWICNLRLMRNLRWIS